MGGAATTASGVAVGGSVGGQEGSPASGVDLASGAAAGAPAALSHASYPQPVGLGPALLSAELVLLGRIMAAGGVAEQLQLLEVRFLCLCAFVPVSLPRPAHNPCC